MTQLERLDLGANQIGNEDLVDLSGLTNLDNLVLNSNSTISDIGPLTTLTSLRFLLISSCTISAIPDLSTLTSLEQLDLGWNNIVDITNLGPLTTITSLSLQSNDIVDLTPIADFTNLDYLYIFENNLDCDSCCIDIPTLEGEGTTVDDGGDCEAAYPCPLCD